MALRALILSLFVLRGMALRSELASHEVSGQVFNYAAHLDAVSSIGKRAGSRPQNCQTEEIEAAAAVYEHGLITSRAKSDKPNAVLMVGGPGAGKTTAREEVAPAEQYAVMDVDHILKHVYNPLTPESYYDCYDDAMVRYKGWLGRLIDARINLVVDGTGRKFDEYLAIARHLSDEEYKVTMVAVVLPFGPAKDRMLGRAQRNVDFVYAEQVYKTIERILPDYVVQDVLEEIYVFNNDVPQGDDPELIIYKGEDGISCNFDGTEDKDGGQLYANLHKVCGDEDEEDEPSQDGS